MRHRLSQMQCELDVNLQSGLQMCSKCVQAEASEIVGPTRTRLHGVSDMLTFL